jgi:hypothetical protein
MNVQRSLERIREYRPLPPAFTYDKQSSNESVGGSLGFPFILAQCHESSDVFKKKIRL